MAAPEPIASAPPEVTSEIGKLLLSFDARLRALEAKHVDLKADLEKLEAWLKRL